MKSILVFCSSSDEVAPVFFSEMELLGRELAQANMRLIYGGAKVGLMGHLANSVLKYGGEAIGVIPEYLNRDRTVHKGLTELIVVGSLMDRKRKMLELCDAAVAAPGGLGTLDEVTESLSLKQLGEVVRPVVFHNFLDFWSPLLDYFEELKARHMISQDLKELYHIYDSASDVVRFLKNA